MTASHNNKRKRTRAALTALAVAFIGVLGTACSKSGDGGGAYVPPVILPTGGTGYFGAVPSCPQCAGNMRFITSTVSRGLSGMGAPVELGMDVYGDASAAMQSTYTIGSYFGPFAVTGSLFLQGGLMECGIPPGRYVLQTQSPGIWGNDGAGRSGENIMLILLGAPIQINVFLSGYTMPATPAAQGMDGRVYPYTFQTTTMQVKRIDTAAVCNLVLQ